MTGMEPMTKSMAEFASILATTTRGRPMREPRHTTKSPRPPLTRSPKTGNRPMIASIPRRRPPVPGTGMLLSSSHARASTSVRARERSARARERSVRGRGSSVVRVMAWPKCTTGARER
jgi:hypothetical protein